MVSGIKFGLTRALFTKDPQDTELGKKILQYSVLMIDEIGFESFTFKKLAKKIGSAEKSIYRYFDNKHLLLLFLTSWYWEWVHYLININIKNLHDPHEQLAIAIRNIVHATSENASTEYINENLLHRVIVNEGSKAYHTVAVDAENKVGLFLSYKELTQTLAGIILKINPSFPYPLSLASNLFEMSNNQFYFSEHLPQLTDICLGADRDEQMIKMLIFYAEKLVSE